MDKRQVGFLCLISVLCVFGHLFSPPSWEFAHEFLFKLTYLPIVLSAIWIHRRCSILLTSLFCVVYVFHIYFQLHHHFHHVSTVCLDLGLYLVVSWITGTLSDHQKRTSQTLVLAYRDLKEKTEALVEFEANARKTERLKTMGELAGTVAHEIRTPLSGIQGAVEIIVSEKSSAEAKIKFSKTVYQEVKRINGVVESFLQLGKEQTSQKDIVNLRSFLLDSTTLIEPVLKKKNIRLEINVPENMSIKVEKNQLKQVLINLVMNASRACEGQGDRVEICWDSALEGIMVKDNGVGVPEEIKPHLFQAFTTGRKDGHGLGLYLSRNIMRALDGELSLLHSERGRTEFLITLPQESP